LPTLTIAAKNLATEMTNFKVEEYKKVCRDEKPVPKKKKRKTSQMLFGGCFYK
jgi:hypothetical protein